MANIEKNSGSPDQEDPQKPTKAAETRTPSRVERTKKYFMYLLLILILVQIMDAYSTAYTATFPSKIIEEFLPGYGQNEADALMSIAIGIATFGMYFVFVNQYFADRIGRKWMLAVTTFGMGFCAFLLTLSTDIWSYTLFLFLTYLFFSSDMWLIYINEEAPPEKRGLYTNIVLALGILGPILSPIFRGIFITETSPVGSWRGMTWFLIILGIPLSIVILFTVKETSKYEEIKVCGDELGLTDLQIKFKENLRTINNSPRRKEILILLIMSFLLGFNFTLQQLGESFIQGNTDLTEKDINNIIMVIAISVIIGYLGTGILADKIGRVPLIYIFAVTMILAPIILFMGGQADTTAGQFALCALGIGIGYVSYNGLHIVIRLITVEIIPTGCRGTCSGLRAFVQAVGITGGFFLGSIITRSFGLGVTFIVFAIPLVVYFPLTLKFLKETKGTDLSTIQA